MSQTRKTIRNRRPAALLALAIAGLAGGAVSPWAGDAIVQAVHFRTAMSDSVQPPVAPAQLLFAGVPPLA